jgi:hypothetical protein
MQGKTRNEFSSHKAMSFENAVITFHIQYVEAIYGTLSTKILMPANFI